jgi:hypothetical protein
MKPDRSLETWNDAASYSGGRNGQGNRWIIQFRRDAHWVTGGKTFGIAVLD